MEKKKTGASYIYMVIAGVGIFLLAFGLLEYILFVGNVNTPGFFLTFIGFIILVHYIYYLEKKNGMSNKVIWIKSGMLILSLLTIGYLFY
ncbi:hypothetical protein [Planococcus halocryophilus]|uniref:hypothetical protein n=1 Tax=Planococcus halocryophilus TaxID=1215089 RepID=UPI001F103526|nr:hypothetical protein [Planococcus halocryophilus]MCH4825725.1 hypothetical protein [Planococcus halocryophilus]